MKRGNTTNHEKRGCGTISVRNILWLIIIGILMTICTRMDGQIVERDSLFIQQSEAFYLTPYTEVNLTVTPVKKQRIPESVRVITVYTLSIALNAIGDGLNDDGKKEWGHACNAMSYGLLLATPFIFNVDKSNWGWYVASYVSLRIALFNPIYNGVRGLPIGYYGDSSISDKFLGWTQPPPGLQLFGRAIFLGIGVSIPINEF